MSFFSMMIDTYSFWIYDSYLDAEFTFLSESTVLNRIMMIWAGKYQYTFIADVFI